MRRTIQFISDRFQKMPKGLVILTRCSLFFIIFTPMSLLPFGYHVINGEQVSFGEFWRRGGGPIFFVLGIYFGFLAYGFLNATRWSRLLCFLPLAIQVVALIFHPRLDGFIALSATLIIVVWYLFYRKNVRDYYSQTDDTKAA